MCVTVKCRRNSWRTDVSSAAVWRRPDLVTQLRHSADRSRHEARRHETLGRRLNSWNYILSFRLRTFFLLHEYLTFGTNRNVLVEFRNFFQSFYVSLISRYYFLHCGFITFATVYCDHCVCVSEGVSVWKITHALRYDTIRYDSVYLTCSKKLMDSQLSLPHEINKNSKCENWKQNDERHRSGPVPLSWGSPVGKRNLRWKGFVEKVGFKGTLRRRLTCIFFSFNKKFNI